MQNKRQIFNTSIYLDQERANVDFDIQFEDFVCNLFEI